MGDSDGGDSSPPAESSPPPTTTTAPPPAAEAVSIAKFDVQPDSVAPGGSVTIEWAINGSPSSYSIEGFDGALQGPSGSTTMVVNDTVTLTLIADGVRSDPKTVTAAQPATTTTAPPPTTTTAPPATTTTAPPPTTTTAPPPTTTTAPPATTTTAPPPTTTTAPPPTTTTAPPPTTTTAPPPTTTTAPPPTTTTAPPPTTTTAPPPTTTTAPPPTTTTAPPATTTTVAPLTAAPAAAPTLDSVSLAVDPQDSSEQNPHSYQVANTATLTLSWSASNASSVNVNPIAQGLGASGSQAIPAQDSTITVVALADGGAQSDPYTIEIHTHAPGETVSPHADVSVAKVVSCNISKDGATVTSAAVGDDVVLTIVVSDGADGAQISGGDVALSTQGDGSKQGSTHLTLTAPMSGDITFAAMQGGNAADTQTLHIDITAAVPGSTTTATPATTTPATTTTEAAEAAEGDGVEVEIWATDEGGSIFEEECGIAKQKSVTLHWKMKKGTASKLTLNDAAVDIGGSQAVSWGSNTKEGDETKFHIFAQDESGKSDSKDFTVKFVKDASETGTSVAVKFSKKFESPPVLTALESYGELTVFCALEIEGDFIADGENLNAQWDDGAKEEVAAKFSPDLFGMDDFTLKGAISGTEASVSGEAAWKHHSLPVTGKIEVKASGFKAEHKGTEWEVDIATIEVTGGAEFAGDVELGAHGKFTGKITPKVGGTLKPNWGRIFAEALKEAGWDFLEGAAIDIAVPVTAIVLLGYAWYSLFKDIAEFNEMDSKLAQATNDYGDGFKEGLLNEGATGSLGEDAKPYEQGSKRGHDHRGTLWSSWYTKITDGMQDAVNKGATQEEAETKAKEAFQKKLEASADDLVGKVKASCTGVVKPLLYDKYFDEHKNLSQFCESLFIRWFLGGSTSADASVWRSAPQSSLSRYKQLPNVVLPPDMTPAKPAGQAATDATVDKVWRWMQDHTQSSAADFSGYDADEVHLNTEQVGNLNMKMSAQNAGA